MLRRVLARAFGVQGIIAFIEYVCITVDRDPVRAGCAFGVQGIIAHLPSHRQASIRWAPPHCPVLCVCVYARVCVHARGRVILM